MEFWQPSLRKNYISFPILVETFGQRLEYFPSSISSAAGDQRSPGHSALSSLAENWHDCILNLHCRMEERHQAEAGQGLRKNFWERALGDLGEEFPKPKLEMMRCHLQQQQEVPPRAVFWVQSLLPTPHEESGSNSYFCIRRTKWGLGMAPTPILFHVESHFDFL